jgi:hypothetical protein
VWCIQHIPLYLCVVYPAHTSVSLCGVSSTYLCNFIGVCSTYDYNYLVYPAHTSISLCGVSSTYRCNFTSRIQHIPL